MDVKTTFLNGYLEENIYMMQPDGFITEGQEHMVCKLHKLSKHQDYGTNVLIK